MSPRGDRPRGGRPHGVKSHRLDCLFKRCPCARRRWSDCSHAWFYAIGYAGRGYRGTLNKYFGLPRFHQLTRSEAEELLGKLRVDIHEGRYAPKAMAGSADGEVPTDTRLTVEDVGKLLVKEFAADPGRRRHRVTALEAQLALICRTLIPAARGTTMRLGDLPMAELRTGHVEAFRDARRQIMQAREAERLDRAAKLAQGVPASELPPVSSEVPHRRGGEIGINRHLEVVRQLVSFAILRGFIDTNPFVVHGKRIIRFAPEKPRTRRLLPGEEERILRVASRHLQSIVIAALETGCRKGELLSLQFRDVICNEKGEPRTLALRAENTKTDTARSVPVSPRLRAVLEMRRQAPDGTRLGSDAYVFGTEAGDKISEFKLAWRGALKRAGITGLTFHDLRREHGSRLVEGGVNLLTVSRLLGHKRVSTTDTYLKASENIAERELALYHERRQAANGTAGHEAGGQ